MTTTAVAALPQKQSLVAKFAAKYSIEPDKLMTILKATAFKVKDQEVTNEQMAALLVVADQYGLNPFTREIFAFPDKQNGIVPVVGVDGWSRIVNDHAQSDGFEFRQSEEMESIDKEAQPAPKWMEVVIYRKDRTHPIVVREYLDEVYRKPYTRNDGTKVKGPWQTHTKRFLRHKTFIQGARIAYGFAGIYDEDEAERIIEGEVVRVTEGSGEGGVAALKARHGIGQPAQEAPAAASVEAPVTEPAQAEEKPDPKAKKAGTPKLRKQFVERFGKATPEELDVAYDETRGYIWGKEDEEALREAYEEGKGRLAS